jgi:hypothetical protein
VERLLALWSPGLASDGDDRAQRLYLDLLEEFSVMCPFVDPVRLGLMVLPMRAPTRFFGGEEVVIDHVRDSAQRLGVDDVHLGVADGLFSAFAAARAQVCVPAGHSDEFRRSLPIATLERRELATLCRRLGLHTVGAFADLAPARVAERFDRDALHVHRVARGEEAELVGQRDLRMAAMLRRLRGQDASQEVQGGFFGDHLDADRRAAAVAHRVRLRLGPEGVSTASLVGARAPGERAALVPFGSAATLSEPTGPWPGRLPAPSPTMALTRPVALVLRDERQREVHVDARGLLSDAPVTVVFERGITRGVEWFAGPWPSLERWWAIRRRRAYLQVLTTHEALLVYAEGGRWWLAGVYD